MKPIILGIVLVLAVAVTGYLFFISPATPEVAHTPSMNLYANGTYGISFSYPENYVLSEQEYAQDHYVITLIREEDAVPVIGAGEGPTAITFEIYGQEEGATLSDWLSDPRSNFQLGDGTYASTTVSGNDAVHYGWSGLYEGETTAFLHEGNLIAVSVTYMSPSDPIRATYDAVLASLTLR